MLTFALLRNSSDLHIYKDLYGERNKAEKKMTPKTLQVILPWSTV